MRVCRVRVSVEVCRDGVGVFVCVKPFQKLGAPTQLQLCRNLILFDCVTDMTTLSHT